MDQMFVIASVVSVLFLLGVVGLVVGLVMTRKP